jgi:hypothetical protein
MKTQSIKSDMGVYKSCCLMEIKHHQKVDGLLLNALADRAELCVEDFTPQGLSNVA